MSLYVTLPLRSPLSLLSALSLLAVICILYISIIISIIVGRKLRILCKRNAFVSINDYRCISRGRFCSCVLLFFFGFDYVYSLFCAFVFVCDVYMPVYLCIGVMVLCSLVFLCCLFFFFLFCTAVDWGIASLVFHFLDVSFRVFYGPQFLPLH